MYGGSRFGFKHVHNLWTLAKSTQIWTGEQLWTMDWNRLLSLIWLSDHCELDLEGLELFPIMFFVQLCENFHICRLFMGWFFLFLHAGSIYELGTFPVYWCRFRSQIGFFPVCYCRFNSCVASNTEALSKVNMLDWGQGGCDWYFYLV
jgi:hypothetical protein